MPGRRPPGRPTKLSERVQEKIVTAISNGNYIEVAVRAAGVSPTTYYRWMEQGEADEEHDRTSTHRSFREAVLEATAQAETEIVRIVREAVPNDWRAGIELLKRRQPDRWRDRRGLDVDATVQATADVEVVHNKPVLVVPPDDRREEVARVLAEALGIGHTN